MKKIKIEKLIEKINDMYQQYKTQENMVNQYKNFAKYIDEIKNLSPNLRKSNEQIILETLQIIEINMKESIEQEGQEEQKVKTSKNCSKKI